jgi:hypothetical protein
MVKQVEEAGLAIVAIRGPYNAEPEGHNCHGVTSIHYTSGCKKTSKTTTT